MNNQNTTDGNTTSGLLKSKLKMTTDNLQVVLNTLIHGTSEQKHSAAKAVGYLGESGVLTQSQKADVSLFLRSLLSQDSITTGLAFAVLEALERIDPNSFWALVMAWYGANKQKQSKHNDDEGL